MRFETVKLGDVLEYEQPTKYIVDSINYNDGFTIPVLTAGKSFILGYTDETTGVFDNLPVIIFDDFTTAFHYVDFPFKVKSSAMKILKPLKEKADIKYLYYKMQTISIDSDLHKRYWISKYSQIQIHLPPLPQQQKIANILDAADALRQNDKALIAKYDELTQSLFLDMFGDPVSNPKGWDIKPLGKVCKIQGGYSFKSTDFVKRGVKLVKIANVNFQFLDWEDVDLLPMEFIQKYPNFSLNEGDILMALTRPIIKSLGSVKAVTVKETDLPALLNQRVARFFPKTEILSSDFLLRIIYSDFFKNKIEKLSSTSLQPNVSNKQVENIEIFLPPLELQNQFTERVVAIEAQKAIAQASLVKSEELFNSLLQKAFKGELV